MKELKPYKNGYLLILGSGKVMYFGELDLKVFSMAYDEMLYVKEKSRRKFNFKTTLEDLIKIWRKNGSN